MPSSATSQWLWLNEAWPSEFESLVAVRVTRRVAAFAAAPQATCRKFDRPILVRAATVVLLMLTASFSQAQSLRLDGVRLSVSNSWGSVGYPSYTVFVSKTRRPEFFAPLPVLADSGDGLSSQFNLAIDFDFAMSSWSGHRVGIGFSQMSFDQKLHRFPVVDSTIGAVESSARNMFVGLRTRYLYRRRISRCIAATVGPVVSVGLPLSARTRQEFRLGGTSQVNEFFAKRSAMFGIDVPIALRFRVFTATDIEFAYSMSWFSTRVDGNRISGRHNGYGLGLYFVVANRDQDSE